MASGIFKSGVTPISEGGTGKTSWEDALNAFNGIPWVTLSGPDVDLNTALFNVFKVRCNASINTSLATAIGNVLLLSWYPDTSGHRILRSKADLKAKSG